MNSTDPFEMTYLPRHLAQTAARALRTFPAVIVTGARQTGKTTLLRQELGATHRYLSLELPDLRQRALADPRAFFQQLPPPLILDEIQAAPELLPYIKASIDEDRRPGGWLLTGSQRFALMRGVSESLAGRVAVLELEPLSVREARGLPPLHTLGDTLTHVFAADRPALDAAIPPAPDLADWLLRGGFPELRLNPNVDRQLWLGSYIQTYLERDVRDLLQVGDLRAFSHFLALLATRSATLLNLAEFGREVGISAPTARRWLSVLEASHIVQLLPPYHRSFGKRLRKSPKLVLSDPALVTYLAGLHTPEAVLQGPMLGPLTETAVIAEWVKAIRNSGERCELFHWRASDGLEIDLVIEHGTELYGIEVKATASPTPRHADGLARWLSLAGPTARGVLACRVDHPLTLGRGVRAVPWHLAW